MWFGCGSKGNVFIVGSSGHLRLVPRKKCLRLSKKRLINVGFVPSENIMQKVLNILIVDDRRNLRIRHGGTHNIISLCGRELSVLGQSSDCAVRL